MNYYIPLFSIDDITKPWLKYDAGIEITFYYKKPIQIVGSLQLTTVDILFQVVTCCLVCVNSSVWPYIHIDIFHGTIAIIIRTVLTKYIPWSISWVKKFVLGIDFDVCLNIYCHTSTKDGPELVREPADVYITSRVQ